MDSIILSLAIKLYKKLVSFISEYQSDIFGFGTLGNVYIGSDEDSKPSGYTMWSTTNNTYTIPFNVIPHFNNLIIESNHNLTASTNYLFLYVKDTLRIKVNGRLHMNSKSTGEYDYSPFLQKPSAGQSTPSYTASCLKLFLSGRDIRTDLDLKAYGGNANNGTALSGAGTVGGGGGLVCLYHKQNCFKSYNVSTQQEGGYDTTFVTANGGKTGPTGGGMLFVFAKNIIIETDENSYHGSISANGGDGLGLTSYLDSLPSSKSVDGKTNTGEWGGGGVVHHVGLDVI